MQLFKKHKTFHGGVHPAELKELSENCEFEIMPNPKQVVIPLSQHIGKPAKPLVKKGDQVKAGQVIAEQDGFISVPIHSSVSGKVKKVSKENTPLGFPKDAIVIDADESNETDFQQPLNLETVTPQEIQERVKWAGIVGQGGAAFPTFVKITPQEGRKIDAVILNGCECEPYLTRDYRFMLERTKAVVEGLRLIMKSLGVDKGVIGIEDNKPDAIKAITVESAKFDNIDVEVLETKYPQGAEKMLIKAALNREVPPGKLPLDVGVVIQNIGTAVSIYDAVVKGEPQITASMTISGYGINEPKNLIVRVGTSLADVIEYCGGLKPDAAKVISGGPMMGVAQFDFSVPVLKATSGLLAITANEENKHEETACLRCGKCIEVCPLNLVPTKLARFTQLNRLEDAEAYDITVCMECGTCTYTCPANIHLVQWIRLGKQRVIARQRERKTA